MRITEDERTEIVRAISRQDLQAVVYLFGSRADDYAQGGDLDLLVLSEKISIWERLDILAELHGTLGEQKIDEEIVALSPELVRISQKAVDYAERLVNS